MRPCYLRLSITDRCNLRCAYCRPQASAPQTRGELTVEVLLDLVAAIDRLVPLRKIRLTGGEPLMRQDVCALAARIHQRWPAMELCLTTNGVLLAAAAKDLRAAGVARINVSIDAAEPRAFSAITGGRLGAAIDGLRAARAAGFVDLRLNAVLLRHLNGDDLVGLLRLAAEHEAEIRFIELMPIGAGAALFARQYLSADEALARVTRAFPHQRPLPPSATARRHLLRVGGRDVPVGFVTAVSSPFCKGCDRLRLDSRGRLFTCLRSGNAVDLVGAMSQPGGANALLARVLSKAAPAEREWQPRQMAALGG